MSTIRNPKDFWAGLIYLGIGLAALYIAQDYAMGMAVRMGPGYFPKVLGSLLALIGLIALVRSFLRPGEAIGRLAWREALLVLGATVIFGLLVRGAGLALSLLALVVVSAYASKQFRLRPILLLAVGLSVFSVLVFIKGLGIPLPLLGSWIAR
ncbi:MAG: tripartite tricarboxylate transporter TctB family protein [Hydrogenophilaceae bacterium]|nr:tripartite tricarboxylate transporter TctB family protein [Hydrogenophilaceae bacterium]